MLDKETIIWIAYIFCASSIIECVLFCIYKMNQWSSAQSIDGVIGITPGFDAIIALLFAPVFVTIYGVIKIINYEKNRRKNKRNRITNT